MYRSQDLISCQNSKNHFIIENFNINLLQLNLYKPGPSKQSFDERLHPLFQDVTRPSNNGNGKSGIDNIFVKTSILVFESIWISTVFSDYYPLFVAIKERIDKGTDHTWYGINYKKTKNNCK